MNILKNMLIGCFSLFILVFLASGCVAFVLIGDDEPASENVEKEVSTTKKESKMTDESFAAAFGEIITNPSNGITTLSEYINDVSVAAGNRDFNSLFEISNKARSESQDLRLEVVDFKNENKGKFTKQQAKIVDSLLDGMESYTEAMRSVATGVKEQDANMMNEGAEQILVCKEKMEHFNNLSLDFLGQFE